MARKDSDLMSIGRLADVAAVPPTTLRYYEREGILAPTDRTRAGYRLYDDEALKRLEFIRAAQAVGFTLDDIRVLLRFDGESPCGEVQKLIEKRLADVDAKLANLKRVQLTLADALDRCRQSKRGCAVLAHLKTNRRRRAQRGF